MKKIIIIALCAFLALTFVGCSHDLTDGKEYYAAQFKADAFVSPDYTIVALTQYADKAGHTEGYNFVSGALASGTYSQLFEDGSEAKLTVDTNERIVTVRYITEEEVNTIVYTLGDEFFSNAVLSEKATARSAALRQVMKDEFTNADITHIAIKGESNEIDKNTELLYNETQTKLLTAVYASRAARTGLKELSMTTVGVNATNITMLSYEPYTRPEGYTVSRAINTLDELKTAVAGYRFDISDFALFK